MHCSHLQLLEILEMAVAVDQHHEFKSFARPLRCRLQSYSHLDHNMPEFTNPEFAHSLKQAFEVANLHRSFSSPCLPLTQKLCEEDFALNPRVEIIGGHSDPKTRALVVEVAVAVASGVSPVPVSNGLSGAYFLHGRNNDIIAVAKPMDGEPLTFNNLKGFSGRMLGQFGMRRSIRVGETGIRELAAYLLDHDGFSGVPPTALVKVSHIAFQVKNSEEISAPPYRIASLQRFVEHDSDAGDLGPSGFSVSSIHRIGILDIRLLNLDRHAGNMLVKKGLDNCGVNASELVPIDHGLCLPEWLDDPYFEWLHWPQALVPFSETEVEYVLNLDPFKEAELLRKELPSLRESSIRVLVLCTIFLKGAVVAELCIADIGEMMTREFHGGEENLSVLENIFLKAKASMSNMPSHHNGNDLHFDDEDEIFHFDDENEDCSSQVFGISQLLQSASFTENPPETTIVSSTRSLSGLLDEELSNVYKGNIYEVQYEDDFVNKTTENGKIKDNGNEFKAGALTRSMTFSESHYKSENGSVFLGEMSEEEWELFLENFENLLPECFEGRKSMGLMKQRLGTSCEF